MALYSAGVIAAYRACFKPVQAIDVYQYLDDVLPCSNGAENVARKGTAFDGNIGGEESTVVIGGTTVCVQDYTGMTTSDVDTGNRVAFL